MVDLVACLSSGKGTWGHVGRLIQEGEWNNVFLITNEFGKENFSSQKKVEFILIDEKKSIADIREEIFKNLKNKVSNEVALNLVSGTGKEHMAIISSLLKLGCGLVFIALTIEGVKEV